VDAIAQWDALDSQERPVFSSLSPFDQPIHPLDRFVMNRVGRPVPAAIRQERLYLCGREWLARTEGPPAREIVETDCADRYGVWLNGKNKGEPVTELREIQRFFLYRTGFLFSHGQLLGKYANTGITEALDATSVSARADMVFRHVADEDVWNECKRIIDEGQEHRRGYRKKDGDRVRASRREILDRKRAVEDQIKATQDQDSPYRVVLNARLGLDAAAMSVCGIGEVAETMMAEQRWALEQKLSLLNDALAVEEAGHILAVLSELMVESSVCVALVEGLHEVRNTVDAALAKVTEQVIDSEAYHPAGELEPAEYDDEILESAELYDIGEPYPGE
jgi:hypothetical protein